MARESKLEAKLRKRIEAAGGLFIKFESSSRIGVSDRLAVIPGHGNVLVEMKAENGVLSEAQKKWFYEVIARGGKIEIVQGLEQLEKFCYKYLSRN